MERTYTTEAVCRAVGMEERTLRSWYLRVGLPADQEGERRWRRYSVREIVRLGIIKRLADVGVPVAAGAEISAVLLTLGARQFGADQDWPGDAVNDWDYVVLLCKGDDGYYLVAPAKRTLDELAAAVAGQTIGVGLLVNVGQISRDVRTALEAIE